MKLFLANQEIVIALHSYLVNQRNCERDKDESPDFQVTVDNRGLLMVEVHGYVQKITNQVQNEIPAVVQQNDTTADD